MQRLSASRVPMLLLWVLLIAGMVLGPTPALADGVKDDPNGYALPEKPKIFID